MTELMTKAELIAALKGFAEQVPTRGEDIVMGLTMSAFLLYINDPDVEAAFNVVADAVLATYPDVRTQI